MYKINDQVDSTLKNNLPPEADYSASAGLTWNDQKIANFNVSVRNKIILKTDNRDEEFFQLDILNEKNSVITSANIKLSDTEINNINWFSLHNSCVLNPDCPKAKSYLAAIIKHQLNKTDLAPVYCQQINKVGWNKITITDDVIYGYYTGEKIILPQNIDADLTERIKLDKSEYVLKSDTNKYSEKAATAGIIKALSLNLRAGLVIFAFIIASLLKSIFRECGIPPKFVLYVCGPKDFLKTAYISALSPICDKYDYFSKLIIQFTSSSYSITNLTNDYPDFPVVLDNVYESEDPHIKKKITGIFENAVQIIGDDIDKNNARGSYKPASSIIVTGEFDGIGNPSTIARYLTNPVGDDLRNAEKQMVLHKFQIDEPLLIPTFYCYFLQWVVTNIEDIKSGIKDLLTDFREIGDSFNISPKLRERYLVLFISFMLFIKYCVSKKYLTNRETIQLKKDFSDQLLRICHNHNQTIQEKEETKNKNACPDDFFRLIKYWHNNDEFDMAEDEEDENLEYREALIYDGHLCLRTKPLIAKINKSFPNIKLKTVIAQLVAKKVLKSDSSRNTAKIKGLRFLKIPLDKF